LLATQKRFPGKNARAIINAIARGEGPSLRDVRPGLPTGLYDVVEKALAYHRDDRFQTARDFADALSRVAGDLDTSRETLATVMHEHVGDQIRERTTRVSVLEHTFFTAVDSRADDATLIDPRVETTPSAKPVAVIPLELTLPLVERARNWELTADAHFALCRVWSVPEMTRDEGADSARRLLQQAVRVLTDVPARKGFIFDVRDARMVIGGKTLAVLETMFATAEDRGVRIAAVITSDPIQKLDFTDLVERAAPRMGGVFDDAQRALLFIAR
jgi:hypothetical protein